MALVQSSTNFGRLTNLISGIQGVTAGGQMSINMQINQRIHRLNFQTTGIAWVNPVLTVTGTGGGSGAILTPTVTNGVITAVAITAGGTAYSGTISVTVADGIYGTNLFSANITATQSGGVINAVTIVSGGIVSPVPAERFFVNGFIHKVGGSVIRDISVAEVLAIDDFNMWTTQLSSSRSGTFGLQAATVNVSPLAAFKNQALGNTASTQLGTCRAIGQLPIYFSEPWRRFTNHETATSWDLFGQSTYQITASITSNITSPGLVGTYEFDSFPNQYRAVNGKAGERFLKPVKQHSFTFSVPAGMYPITTLPINYAIQRIYLYGAANPYQIEILQDGNKVLEGTSEQVNQTLRDYGYRTDVFDVAAVFDIDQKLHGALKVANALQVKVWNTNAGALTVVMENTPPAYM